MRHVLLIVVRGLWHVEYNDELESKNSSEITTLEPHGPLIVQEWNKFIHWGVKPSHVDESIFKSWQRSKDFQVDPYCGKSQILLSPEELQEKLAEKLAAYQYRQFIYAQNS